MVWLIPEKVKSVIANCCSEVTGNPQYSEPMRVTKSIHPLPRLSPHPDQIVPVSSYPRFWRI
jgi:hypothetical protein